MTPVPDVSVTDLHTNPTWLEGFRHGDRDALSRVYARYAPDLRLRLTRGIIAGGAVEGYRLRIHEDDAREEIIQETFLRALSEKSRARYDGARPFLPYLVRIARNIIVDQHRRSQRYDARFAPEHGRSDGDEPHSRIANAADTDDSPLAMGRSPERASAKQELTAALLTFVRSLEPSEFELLRLYYEDDATQRQAAAQMGVDRNHVRKLIAQIRAKLLEEMRQQGLIQTMSPDELLGLAALVLSSLGGSSC